MIATLHYISAANPGDAAVAARLAEAGTPVVGDPHADLAWFAGAVKVVGWFALIGASDQDRPDLVRLIGYVSFERRRTRGRRPTVLLRSAVLAPGESPAFGPDLVRLTQLHLGGALLKEHDGAAIVCDAPAGDDQLARVLHENGWLRLGPPKGHPDLRRMVCFVRREEEIPEA